MLGAFFITASISLAVIVYSVSLILPHSVLEDCRFLEMYPIEPDVQMCWHHVVYIIFLQSFVFLWSQLLLLLIPFS